jgi:uncharacterized protein (TIGR03435 family)
MTKILAQLVLVVGGVTELAILAKATTILVLALIAVRLSSRTSASMRSLIFASTFGILLILPIAALLMPPLALEVGVSSPGSAATVVSPGVGGAPAPYSIASSIDRSVHSARVRRLPSVRVLLMTTWATGAVLCIVPVVATVWRLRRVRRGALRWPDRETLVRGISREAGVNRQVRVLLHGDVVAPFTYGSLRPAIVMPSDAQEWTNAEIRHAMIHELEHVRRADWPVQVLARVVCGLYWFHPLVWSAWGRLCLESERACDDAVLRSTERTAYAEQLVSLARRLSTGAPAPVLSMANRSDLTARVAAVLDTTQARGRVGMPWGTFTVVVALALLTGISPLTAMSVTSAGAMAQALALDSGKPSFEHASVTPHTPGTPRGIPPLIDDRYTAGDSTLKDLIRFAYGTPLALFEYQVVGGPDWASSDRFDIDAHVGRDVGFGASWHPRVVAMLRTLLADRFKLEVSKETRQYPVADLVLARPGRKPGAGLRPSTGNCIDLLVSPLPTSVEPDRWCGLKGMSPGVLAGQKITMAVLAGALANRPEVDRVVRDRTGLEGTFDFHVEFTPDRVPPTNPSSTPGENASPISPALLAALETELGLRLETHQGPVDVIVIRHAEKPKEQ